MPVVGDGYVIVGYNKHDDLGNQDMYMFKTDLNGNEVWRRTYGDPGTPDWATGVLAAADGGIVVLGGSMVDSVGPAYRVLKTDGEGNIEAEDSSQ